MRYRRAIVEGNTYFFQRVNLAVRQLCLLVE